PMKKSKKQELPRGMHVPIAEGDGSYQSTGSVSPPRRHPPFPCRPAAAAMKKGQSFWARGTVPFSTRPSCTARKRSFTSLTPARQIRPPHPARRSRRPAPDKGTGLLNSRAQSPFFDRHPHRLARPSTRKRLHPPRPPPDQAVHGEG